MNFIKPSDEIQDSVVEELTRRIPSETSGNEKLEAKSEKRSEDKLVQVEDAKNINKKLSFLGYGGICVVFQYKQFAIKFPRLLKYEKYIYREYNILQDLYPSAKTYLITFTPSKKYQKRASLVMPKFIGYDLHDSIFIYYKVFSQVETLKIFENIVKSLVHIHSKNIVHGDIKMENILLLKDFEVQIIDYGSSYYVDEFDKMKISTFGTSKFKPPEVTITSLPFTKKTVQKIDVWSAGIVLYNMLFMIDPPELECDLILKINLRNISDKKILKILKACLDVNPVTRKTSSELLEIVKNINNDD